MLACLRFDVDAILGDVQNRGDSRAHRLLQGPKFGTLRANDAIEIHDLLAALERLFHADHQDFGGIAVAILLRRVGKELADIADARRAEDRVRDRM